MRILAVLAIQVLIKDMRPEEIQDFTINLMNEAMTGNTTTKGKDTDTIQSNKVAY